MRRTDGRVDRQTYNRTPLATAIFNAAASLRGTVCCIQLCHCSIAYVVARAACRAISATWEEGEKKKQLNKTN